MEILYKCIRAIVFPFRFLYLIHYQWRERRKRAEYLRLRRESAEQSGDGAALPPLE